MWYALLVVVFSASVALLGTYVTCSPSCIRACNEEDSSIVCNQSIILISDVTNWMLEKNHVAFENMKRDCMGKESCDLSSACSPEMRQTLVVHYLCVDASHILSKSCNGQHLKMKGNSGYIQSPGYPAVTTGYFPCKWQIEPPNDNVVVLSLHDITVSSPSGSMENCDGGLVVSGRSCDGTNSVFVRRSLCGGDNLTSLVRCGKVDIELSPSHRVYPVRFWLSFHVHSKHQVSSFQTSLLPCSGWIYDMGTEMRPNRRENHPEPTQISVLNSPETNTEVLIIMLSVISGISAVLLIILIVVCVRCRLLQASRTESVFSDPSPGLQAHFKYISSLESEKTRPHLADGYCEVADALPFTQRGETPTSPAYAEVEQFAHLRKTLWSSSSEDGLKGSKPLPGEAIQGDGELKSNGDKYPEIISVRSETAKQKRGVLGRRKVEKDRHGEKEKNVENRKSTGPKIIPASVNKQKSSSHISEAPHLASSTQDCNMASTYSTYEQLGEFSSKILSSNLDQKSSVPNKHSEVGTHYTDIIVAKKISSENCTKTLGRVKDNAKRFASDDAYSLENAPKKPPRLYNSTSTDFSKGSKTLPSRKSKACLQTSGNKNNRSNIASMDVLQATGIVKNGIKKFEQNTSLS